VVAKNVNVTKIVNAVVTANMEIAKKTNAIAKQIANVDITKLHNLNIIM